MVPGIAGASSSSRLFQVVGAGAGQTDLQEVGASGSALFDPGSCGELSRRVELQVVQD